MEPKPRPLTPADLAFVRRHEAIEKRDLQERLETLRGDKIAIEGELRDALAKVQRVQALAAKLRLADAIAYAEDIYDALGDESYDDLGHAGNGPA